MRIAIVNDVLIAVEAMRRVVVSTGEHSVAWVAHDGAAAIELCAQDKPDVILMDLLMPHVDGVEATRRIMERTPCPIVVVTADLKRNYARVFEAMGAGALDAVNTPVLLGPGAAAFVGGGSDSEAGAGAAALLTKIDAVRRLTRVASPEQANAPPPPSATPPVARQSLVAIGASAGGPAALAGILRDWPADFPGAVVMVQHVDAQFAPSLASWLGEQTALHVRLAREGDHPHAGAALLAGQDGHLVFKGASRLSYSDQPRESSFRPSVDMFFKSIARHWRSQVVGVLLTGMGRDGAEGLKTLRDGGHHTIAQDQATSAVYGMPKAAADLGAAEEILPLGQIGPHVARLLAHTPKP